MTREISIEDPADVAQNWAASLQKLLEPIDKLPACSGRSHDILSYLLTGEPVAILHSDSQVTDISYHIFPHYPTNETRKTATEIYSRFDKLPVDVMLRWAKFAEASITPFMLRDYSFQMPGDINWPEILLLHDCNIGIYNYSSITRSSNHLSYATFEKLLLAAEMDPAALLVSAFSSSLSGSLGAEHQLNLVAALKDYSEAVERHIEAVRPHLLPTDVAQRLHVIGMLNRLTNETLAKFAQETAELATSPSKQVRAAAEKLLNRCEATIQPALKVLAVKGKPDQRLNALRLLWSFSKNENNETLRNFLRETAKADKAPSVQALISEWNYEESRSSIDIAQYEYVVPEVCWSNALTPSVSTLLDDFWNDINAAVARSNRRIQEYIQSQIASGSKVSQIELYREYSITELKILKDYVASPLPVAQVKRENSRHSNHLHITPAIQALATNENITLPVLLKILAYFDLMIDYGKYCSTILSNAINVMYSIRRTPRLLELSIAVHEFGITPKFVFEMYSRRCKGWAEEDVWPFFANNQEMLDELLKRPYLDENNWLDLPELYGAVAMLPTTPPKMITPLFEAAFGSVKAHRLMAQDALARMPGKEERIINALADGKAEIRTIAAQWLARLKYKGAIPALEAAVAKEKNDFTKGAMLDTLELLGQPIEKYLDRKSLVVEANKLLKKGLPKELDWFPWAAMPTVRWADSHEIVSTETLQWMLVQSVKQKSPEPNSVLRKYCSILEPHDREAFGQFILEVWLAEDLKPIPAAEAEKMALIWAQNKHTYMTQSPALYREDPDFGRSVEELYAKYLPGLLRTPAGSAISSKGVLALSAACAGERAAAPVARYLKEYYGTRAAQGKALISMLAWIEHPTATQLMLSIGNRFRTKSIQEEATRQAEALAERKGWTINELADRTVPTAGFDEAGILQLDYGKRVFSAKLLDNFKVDLFNPEGKKVAALPEPRQDDDREMAANSRKAFTNAKKEIKTVVDLQTNRLYEALCTGRDWLFDDWNRYLNQHPIVRKLVQRLIWNIVQDDQVIETVRPLDDGTLTNHDDTLITPPKNARIQIAHDSNLRTEQVSVWQQHLLDYEITPLFQQFGKTSYVLSREKENELDVRDFEGYIIDSFALRGGAFKLGYTRGAAEDGGWFYVYEKRFSTLGLVTLLEFTGNTLPEESRTVALLSMSFSSSSENGFERTKIPLKQIPPVLLSECYNDLRLIAAQGSGFDSKWREKTEYV